SARLVARRSTSARRRDVPVNAKKTLLAQLLVATACVFFLRSKWPTVHDLVVAIDHGDVLFADFVNHYYPTVSGSLRGGGPAAGAGRARDGTDGDQRPGASQPEVGAGFDPDPRRGRRRVRRLCARPTRGRCAAARRRRWDQRLPAGVPRVVSGAWRRALRRAR